MLRPEAPWKWLVNAVGTSLLATVVLATGPAAGQDRVLLQRGTAHWESARYGQAYPDLREYRRGFQGRTATVDYMIGTSACRLDRLKEFGFRTLDWLLYAYPLSEAGRAQVLAERDLCLNAVLDNATSIQLAELVLAGVTGRGKLFHWADNRGLGAYPIRRTRDIDREVFMQRLVPVEDADRRATVVARAGEQVGTAYVVSAQGYVIASTTQRTTHELQSLAAMMDRFTGFQVATFGMERPPYVITLYLTDYLGELRELAQDLHGLDISPSTIGYSFVDDMTVAAVAPGNIYGTVLHELTHLLIRGNFGDAPQWIDEGLSSLYEVSGDHNGYWLGEPNWRGRILRGRHNDWPTLEQIIQSPWFAFDDPEHSLAEMESVSAERQAMMTAYNRYFLLYLQEAGLLPRVFKAVRSGGLGDADTAWKGASPGAHMVALVEEALGGELADIDAQFRTWLGPVLEGGFQRAGLPVDGGPVGKLSTGAD